MATSAHSPEVLVIGLGAMGSATLHHLAAAGADAMGLDQFDPPHVHGSTHGETRITREAVGEGAAFVPLVMRSHRLWRQLEDGTGSRLFNACGGLIMARAGLASHMHAQADFLGQTIHLARQFGIAHEVLEARDIATRFPLFALQGDERGYFEPGAGYLNPEECVRTQLLLAARRGAKVRRNERVVAVRHQGQRTIVETAQARYTPGTTIITAGPWLPLLMPEVIATPLRVLRQTLFWFEPAHAADFSAGPFPVFIWHWGDGADEVFYGFPDIGSGVKVATEQSARTTTPAGVDRNISATEVDAMFDRHVRHRLPGLRRSLKATATCLYTSTPDAGFIIGRPPAWPSTIIVSACSGHGFKHSAAIGEAVAEMAMTGTTPAILAPFQAGLASSAP